MRKVVPLLIVTAIVSLLLSGLNESGARANTSCASSTLSTLLVPTCGVLWGGYVTGNAAVAPLEAQVGRPFDIVHTYQDWSGVGTNGQFPTAVQQQEIATGHIMYFAWGSKIFSSGTYVPWADIGSGSYDTSVIDPEATRLKAMGSTKVFMDFDHEPDNSTHTGSGTATDYVLAYRHIHDRLAADGVTNVVWVWAVTGSNTSVDVALYPGDSYVDWIGWDPYNFYGCGGRTTWKDVPTTFSSFYSWLDAGNLGATAAAKPRMLPEYGSAEDSADTARAGAWYASVPGYLQSQFPKIKAAIQFDSNGTCPTALTNTTTLAGFAQAGQSDYVNVYKAGLGVVATTTTTTLPTTTNTSIVVPPVPVTTPVSKTFNGYVLATASGNVYALGDSTSYGSMNGKSLNKPIVGIADTPSHHGYWMVATDGGIFSYGDAAFYGSTGSIKLNQPIVGMASTPDGNGYWLVASDGGVFAYGDARFFGSTGSMTLNKPIVTMASTPSGNGYWLIASDGGVFAYGDATFKGSTGSIKLNQPIVTAAPTSDGNGYWLVAKDGGVFNFGDAPFLGSAGGLGLSKPVVAVNVTGSGNGYRLLTRDGTSYVYGDASFLGAISLSGTESVVGAAG